MAEFVNTLDTMTPEAAEDAVITGLSELVEYRIPEATHSMFDFDKTIRKVILPAAVVTSSYSFRNTDIEEIVIGACNVGYCAVGNCNKLWKLDMAGQDAISNIAADAGGGLTALTTLVLRSVVVVPLRDTKYMKDTPIAAGTGCVYVPRHLIDQYRAATNWSVYATQFRVLQDYTVDGTIDGELDESKI